MKFLSVREPWASLCVMSSRANPAIPIKSCEIRTWKPPSTLRIGETIAIHASSDDSSIDHDIDYAINHDNDAFYALESPDCVPCVPGKDYFYSSVIVGVVDVIGCVEIDPEWTADECRIAIEHAGFDAQYANWAKAPYSWILKNPRRFRQGFHLRGSLGVRAMPADADLFVKEMLARNDFIGWHCSEDPEVQPYQLIPDRPHGIAKCLGKPNYAEIRRNAEERLKQS